MTPILLDIAAYSLQLAVLIVTAIALTRLVPIAEPRAELYVWRSLLAVAVLLPAIALLVPGSVNRGLAWGRIVDASPAVTAAIGAPDWPVVALSLILVGAAVRVGWLVMGLVSIGRCVARARGIDSPLADSLPSEWEGAAEVRLSDDVETPATVGWRRPVVLVPRRFLDLPAPVRRAVLWHEMSHVLRRDWAWRVIEELWCGLLWFNPAARALVSRLDLAREMVVDDATIAATGDRRAYAQALLAFGDRSTPHVAVAPLIRPRHLSRRVARIAQEVPMSRRSSLVALVIVALVCTATLSAAARLFPMSGQSAARAADGRASPSSREQEVLKPGDGVTLPRVVHEVRPEYTPEALAAKVQGSVQLAVVVRSDGAVGHVDVSQSLDQEYGLDRAAVDAARQWRFEPGRKEGRPVDVQVTLEMTFTLKP